jgi:hypothetical protein
MTFIQSHTISLSWTAAMLLAASLAAFAQNLLGG